MNRELQAESPEGIGELLPEIRRGREVLYLSRREVVTLAYDAQEVLELCRLALAEQGRKRTEMPAKIGIHPIVDTFHHAMPAYVPAARALGLKWVACFPENHRYGLDQTSALIIVNDIQTGFPLAILDGTWITAKRTAAVSALAAEKLARSDSAEIGILGCGVQGHEHVLSLSAVIPGLRKIKVRDIRAGAAQRMVDSLKDACGGRFEIVAVPSDEELVRNSDVVVTATAIVQDPEPCIRDSWIAEGALLLPVDFDSMFEWETIARADKFLVDSLAEMEYFMSVGYLAHGLPPLYAEIGEVVAGLKPGRERQDEMILDMNIGIGVLDVVIAKDVVSRALRADAGRRLPL